MHKISLYKRVGQNDFVAKENALTVHRVNKYSFYISIPIKLSSVLTGSYCEVYFHLKCFVTLVFG